MTVYNINLGIGWASSGVEYAQAYRSTIFKNTGIKAKFVFMDMFLQDNLSDLTRNMGFEDEDIIWLYSYFTDLKIAPTTYTVKDLERKFLMTSRVVRLMVKWLSSFVPRKISSMQPTCVKRVKISFTVWKKYRVVA